MVTNDFKLRGGAKKQETQTLANSCFKNIKAITLLIRQLSTAVYNVIIILAYTLVYIFSNFGLTL